MSVRPTSTVAGGYTAIGGSSTTLNCASMAANTARSFASSRAVRRVIFKPRRSADIRYMVSKSVMRARTAFVVCFLILASVGVHPQSWPFEAITEPAAYEVYAALLPKLWPVATANATNIVIQAETVIQSKCWPTGLPTGKPLEAEWQSVIANWKLENTRYRTLLPQFPAMVVPYQLVSAANIPGFPVFYTRFPESGGYYAVSAVGFNESKTRAMVNVENYCGISCAAGRYHLLEKHDGQWVQAKMRFSECLWEQ
jgi:hypothetical protein